MLDITTLSPEVQSGIKAFEEHGPPNWASRRASMINIATLHPCVQAGIKRLEEANPPDWKKKLGEYAGKINVLSIRNCPLGIIYGDFLVGYHSLGLSDKDKGSKYGFDINSALSSDTIVVTSDWNRYAKSLVEDEQPSGGR